LSSLTLVTATRPGRSLHLLVALVALALAASACGGSSSATSTGSTSVTGKFKAPLPAGKDPSTVSKEVCSTEAPHDVAEALGEKAVVSKPTWVDDLYTCRYSYGTTEAMTLSVKELSSWPETYAYFDGLETQLGVTRRLQGLGQGAFQTPNGSVVVRKDWKVLLVDVSQLPPSFGNPPTTPGVIGLAVADVVLGCWAGD